MFFKILRVFTVIFSIFFGIMFFANFGETEGIYYIISCISSVIFSLLLSRIIYLSDSVDELNAEVSLHGKRIAEIQTELDNAKKEKNER